MDEPDTGQSDARVANHQITLDTKLKTTALNDTYSPLSSRPLTPNLHTPSSSRRTSQVAHAPVASSHSPRPQHDSLRRASSSASLNKLPPSPRLARKSSRTSLGGASDETERRPTPKRSISNLISGLREAQAHMEAIEEPIPLTPAQIATDHFTRELLGHVDPDVEADTVFVLHDACYGHRYSRLKTTKTSLSLIVERPERVHASILGACTAYVRIGGHHADGKRAPRPDRKTVSNPPFKIRRSRRSMDITSTCVTNVHGAAWMSELQEMCRSAPERLATGAKELCREATPGQPDKPKLHEGDLYLAPESLNAFQGALGGVADAVDAVFEPASATKKAFVAVRPPGHHCSADHPSGFCWLNNVHVGIEYAAQTHGLTHAAILDFDLHHGDGSQAITWERNSKNNVKRLNAKPNSKLKLSPDIGYYSIHDINSYPCEMGDDEKVQAASLCIENAHGQSIWNVHLQPWKTEADFWKLYEDRYRVVLDKARNFLELHDARIKSEGKLAAKSAIFISAGFDASEWEGSGMQRHSVNVPTEFYARFTQDVVRLAEEVASCRGRVVSVLEGGYSDRALCSGVFSHLSGLCATPVSSPSNGLVALMDQMTGLSINGNEGTEPLRYDKEWWSAANLTALENQVNPPPPPAAGKKVRTGSQPTYATPTESFAYKVIDPHKFARSISSTMREGVVPTRPPTPPAPPVDWIVATQELSKLLIPVDRQTKSCTPEELAMPRTKKERQSDVSALSTREASQPRQLRDRKAKVPTYADSAHSDELDSVRSMSRAESRASRRETIDVLPSEEAAPVQQRRVSRRSSAGSALGAGSSAIDADAPLVPGIDVHLASRPSAVGSMKPPPVPTSAHDSSVQNKKVRAASKPGRATDPTNTINNVGTVKPPTSTAPLDNASTGKNADMENLTSGMKKITIKVPATKEEHDRKLKERLDAERRARALKAAETRRVNAAAKKATKDDTAMDLARKAKAPLASAQPPTAVRKVDTNGTSTPSTGNGIALREDAPSGPMTAGNAHTNGVSPSDALYTPVSFAHENVVAAAESRSTHDAVSGSAATDISPLRVSETGLEMSEICSTPDPFVLSMEPPPVLPHSTAEERVEGEDFASVQNLPESPARLPASDGNVVYHPDNLASLPVWSSTGPIPFAQQQHEAARSSAEVPEQT